MNKRELIVAASENTGKPQVLIEEVFDEIQRLIIEELVKKNTVSISGFGTFWVIEKPESQRINYFTKEKIVVAAKTEPKFRFSNVFKAQVNRY
ncbi:Histone-like DNA-binding superfamily protein HimA [Metamycoplasma arthritidis]|uniref:DNA-binding protein HU n=1 Tax=Metamycoplasma arthritidis (strain 158L3-1) TaxID=243272 RepID=B3PME4_META1|nr:HU family DNA-binding protein [Metamycoplasma arthritidis]ACF07196.1 DNA-binding protein HU [Metamycoplasma arthritidis 158L3-1]VEU78720.1 Histone-like DNA-binding superfamily protein HimA [Metamycoplasma arthritidis]